MRFAKPTQKFVSNIQHTAQANEKDDDHLWYWEKNKRFMLEIFMLTRRAFKPPKHD